MHADQETIGSVVLTTVNVLLITVNAWLLTNNCCSCLLITVNVSRESEIPCRDVVSYRVRQGPD
nr:MAG TPA_asm: hypothetical protein [Caudoviricetes sp.]